MFCPECGTRIDEKGARFCPECGTRLDELEEPAQPADPTATAPTPADSATAKEDSAEWGLILTNCRLLAAKLGGSVDELKQLLHSYIEARNASGVEYELIDADNYSFRKRGFLGRTRTVSLQPDSPWGDYLDLLDDAVEARTGRRAKGQPLYLFILGSNDIIPMPCVPHPVKEVSDNDIDTDLLWAYPYGKSMVDELQSLNIFHYDQQLMVGRLPVGNDTDWNQFVGYLQRASDNSYGIPSGLTYGQCDPHWKRVSSAVASGVATTLRNLGALPAEGYYRGLILSPAYTAENLNKVFAPDANLYYFNLHGSNAPEAAGYYGTTLEQRPKCYTVMHPLFMQACQEPNVVACEACYGARHRGMDREHSTLLAALYAETLLFVGSSRIAWGDVDAVDGSAPTPMLADTLVATFMNALQAGYTAGLALFLAKSAVMQQDSQGRPHTAATLLEFNLFGDPSLYLNVWDDEQSDKANTDNESADGTDTSRPTAAPAEALTQPASQSYVCQTEVVGGANATTASSPTASLLQRVRAQVNANVMHIHDQMARHLYSRYGIPPRPADAIFRVRYADGTEEFRFDYTIETEGEVKQTLTLSTDTQGSIKHLIATK